MSHQEYMLCRSISKASKRKSKNKQTAELCKVCPVYLLRPAHMATIESDCINKCTINLYRATISFIQLVSIWVLLNRIDHNTRNFMPYCNNQPHKTNLICWCRGMLTVENCKTHSRILPTMFCCWALRLVDVTR